MKSIHSTCEMAFMRTEFTFLVSCCCVELWQTIFAPLESELQTRAMAELMGFARMGHETIDVSLTRFEVLRHRAAQRGGLMMNTTTLSYLLLNGLRLRPEQWERALMPLDGPVAS